MPDRPEATREVRLSKLARRDFSALLLRSQREFGMKASRRYAALVDQALFDIGEDPNLAGSMARAKLLDDGVRIYPIAMSRPRVPGPRVVAPRHILLYRPIDAHTVEVARILHDPTDFERHIPVTYRATE